MQRDDVGLLQRALERDAIVALLDKYRKNAAEQRRLVQADEAK